MSQAIKLNRISFNWRSIILFVVLGILFVITLREYVNWQSVNFIVGMLALPLIVQMKVGHRSHRYLLPAFVVSTIAIWLPVNPLLYFAFVFTGLFFVEQLWGRTNNLLCCLLLFLSPVFQYLLNTVSFPLRLKLTSIAGYFMQLVGMTNEVEGNIIVYNGTEFSVDPACMGLNMLLLSFILAVIILAHWERKSEAQFHGWVHIFVFAITILLNVTTNLFRILTMVQFHILPGDVMHEIVGILFFIFYVITPLFFIVRALSKSRFVMAKVFTSPLPTPIKYSHKQKSFNPSHGGDAKRLYDKYEYPAKFYAIAKCFIKRNKVVREYSHSVVSKSIQLSFIILLALLSFASYKNVTYKSHPIEISSNITVNGFTSTVLPFGVTKLVSPETLVYIKPIPAFFNAEHSPTICWKGSGYNFEQVREETISGKMLYSGRLKKGNEELFTAWWYQFDNRYTINQWEWRVDMLKHDAHYSLVNVTAASRESLEKELAAIFRSNPFVKLLK